MHTEFRGIATSKRHRKRNKSRKEEPSNRTSRGDGHKERSIVCLSPLPKHLEMRREKKDSIKTNRNDENPLYLTQISGYLSFSFLTPSLLAFPWYQSTGKDKKKKDQKHQTHRTSNRDTLETNQNQPKGYTAAVNGYFGFNAVAQSGPGIQK
jgi:hypothetical protein